MIFDVFLIHGVPDLSVRVSHRLVFVNRTHERASGAIILNWTSGGGLEKHWGRSAEMSGRER